MEQIPLLTIPKGTPEKVTCPFCGSPIDRPKEVKSDRPGQMPVGQCGSCGAVYACDVTGHNLGAAFVEALVFACNLDWELAWSLLPDEDYLHKLVDKYDIVKHCIVPGGILEGRRVAGALSFVRLHQDVLEVTREGVQKKLARAAAALLEPTAEEGEAKTYTKKEVEELVRAYQIEPLLRAARHDKKTIRHLQRLLCANDELLRLRAADILGRACAVAAATEPKAVVALLQGLFYPFTYSNASSWGSIEAIGEIIANVPALFAGYISTLYQFMEDPRLRPKVLWALARVANARPDLLHRSPKRVLPYIHSTDPETRGYTVWLLGNVGAREAREIIKELQGDTAEVSVYEAGELTKKTVGQLVAEAVEKMQ
ncbi:MAG TPA: PBS lyase [Desulfotomaculum sp.]|nr:PBS lyase [Desulfotomaculum sp.]